MCSHCVFQRVSAAIGVTLNTFLIFLILFKSPKKLGSYKVLMIYIAIFEIMYALLDGLLVPSMFSKNSGALVITSANDAVLPIDFLLAANSENRWETLRESMFPVLYCTFFGMSMAVFAIHFVYRYLIVTGSGILKSHNFKVILLLFLLPILFGLIWSAVTYFTMKPFEEADRFLQKYYLDSRGLLPSDVFYVGMYFYPEEDFGTGTTNWKTIFGFSFQGLFINISFFLIFYFGYKCHRHTKILSQKTSLSSSSYENLQSQLFYALVFQTVIPIFLMHTPSTISFFAAFFNISIEFVSQVLSCTIALYPALDPLPNFFIIKSYRKAILDFMKQPCGCRESLVQMAKSQNESRISII